MATCCSYEKLVEKPHQFFIDEENYVCIVRLGITDIIQLQKFGVGKTQEHLEELVDKQADIVSRCVVDDNRQPLMNKEQALGLGVERLATLFTEAIRITGLEDIPKNLPTQSAYSSDSANVLQETPIQTT